MLNMNNMFIVTTVNKILFAFETALIFGYYGDFSRLCNARFSAKIRSAPQSILRANL